MIWVSFTYSLYVTWAIERVENLEQYLKIGGRVGQRCLSNGGNCLKGADIDDKAVEGRPRRQLSLTMGVNNPEPLPDLTFNICQGDSLSEVLLSEDTEQVLLKFDSHPGKRELLRKRVSLDPAR